MSKRHRHRLGGDPTGPAEQQNTLCMQAAKMIMTHKTREMLECTMVISKQRRRGILSLPTNKASKNDELEIYCLTTNMILIDSSKSH